MKAPTSSIGSGKMIVEFFSAEIEFKVCRYLREKIKQEKTKKNVQGLQMSDRH